MQSISDTVFVEIKKNTLRLLIPNQTQIKVDLDETVAQDTKIISLDDFSSLLKSTIKASKVKVSKIVFIVEEKDFYDRFFVVRGDDKDVTGSLREQASLFVGSSLDDLYCVYQKVSPFVYQFIGVKKNHVDAFTSVASSLSLKLVGIFPISFVFVKLVSSFDPFLYIFRDGEESTLIASEYGGVYFSGTFTTTSEVNAKTSTLLNELSTFNRERPLTNVYFTGENIEVGPQFTTKRIDVEGIDNSENKGFEKLIICSKLLKDDFSEIEGSYFNLKNFTEHRVGSRKPFSIVKYTVPALVVASVVGVVFYLSTINKPADSSSKENPQVIGANQVIKESESKDVESSPSAVVVDKKTVKIRVENGAGVVGTAAKARDFLTGLSYSVIEVGNASKFDYPETVVSYKQSKKDFMDTLLNDLKQKYSPKTGEVIAEDKQYDFLIIIGKK